MWKSLLLVLLLTSCDCGPSSDEYYSAKETARRKCWFENGVLERHWYDRKTREWKYTCRRIKEEGVE